MDIVIFGEDENRRNELQSNLRAYLGESSPVNISQIDTSGDRYCLEQPPNPSVMFFIIDKSGMLLYSEKASKWGADYPLVMAATHPQYAFEGIRQRVCHYILFPLEQAEIEEALKRTGVIT